MKTEQQTSNGISSFFLHILAMLLMLCDHVWATLLPAQEWLTCIGRIAFPIFAFMIAEGYFRTSNIRKYIFRLFIFAVISEVPFDLIYGSSLVYPFHQNVLWTFLLALLLIILIEKARAKQKRWLTVLVSVTAVFSGFFIGSVTMVDYYGAGVVTVLAFYFFHGRKWWCFLGQFICMYILNVKLLGGYYYSIRIGRYELELIQQSLAMLALFPIWFYKGRQGYHKRWFQYVCYAFYPVHLILLYFLWQWSL